MAFVPYGGCKVYGRRSLPTGKTQEVPHWQAQDKWYKNTDLRGGGPVHGILYGIVETKNTYIGIKTRDLGVNSRDFRVKIRYFSI